MNNTLLQKAQKLEATINKDQKELNELKSKIEKEKGLDFFEDYDKNTGLRGNMFDFRIVNRGVRAPYKYDMFLSEYQAEESSKRFFAERILEYEIAKINHGWKPDWNDSEDTKYYFIIENKEVIIYQSYVDRSLANNNLYCKVGGLKNLLPELKNYSKYNINVFEWYFGCEVK